MNKTLTKRKRAQKSRTLGWRKRGSEAFDMQSQRSSVAVKQKNNEIECETNADDEVETIGRPNWAIQTNKMQKN